MYHYQPLKDFLSARGDRSVNLSFEEIEGVIGRPLPKSARSSVSRQWWANTASHSQARAWLSLGRKAKLDVEGGAVTFSRPAPSTTLPAVIRIETSGLHPVTLRLLEQIIAENKLSAEAAAAALLNSGANALQPAERA